ncbi:MAG: hypothetical protein LBQ34_04355, partial [Alphaproteobacteria bacterium]|nr:hypothetical protein [Alphaproteobacteria bacterium]
MSSSVVYNPEAINVSDPRRENVVIYAHPGDRINIGFDVSSLRSEIVNGDLVIRTLGGGSITIANYSIMALQDKAPQILDSLAHSYSLEDFLGSSNNNSALINSFDAPSAMVVSRVISTPRSMITGEFLSSGETFLTNGQYNSRKLVGMIDVDEQHPILAQDVSLSPYMMLRLFPEGTAAYDAEITYRYNGRTLLNQDEPSTLPVVTRTSNPKSAPIYGTGVTYSTPTADDGDVFQKIEAMAGGGDFIGNDYATYQYSPQLLDYSTINGSLLFKDYVGNDIVRGLSIYITDGNSTLSSILIQNVPDGVVFNTTDLVEVQPLGQGMFYITPKSQSQVVNLYFTYKEANAVDSYGNPIGLEDIMQQIQVQIEGYNAKFQQLVLGRSEVTLDFRQVHQDNDLNNFSMYNTYTYSTLFDPLIVRTTSFDDVVYGGVAHGHIYDLLDGNDVFYGSTGDAIVYMGEGDDTYYYGWGNDYADGKATMGSINNPTINGVDAIRFQHNEYRAPGTGQYIFNQAIKINFNNGVVNVNNQATNPFGNIDNSNSTFKNFDELYLEDSMLGDSANSDNTITITSTAGFNGFKIYSGGNTFDATQNANGGDTLVLGAPALIAFNDTVGAYVSTVTSKLNVLYARDFNDNEKIYFGLYDTAAGGTNYFRNIQGSSGNDYLRFADDKNFSIIYNGNGGNKTLDFSLVNGDVKFSAVTGEAEYGSSNDILRVNNGTYIGTDGKDTIFGSGSGSMIYRGKAEGSQADTSGDTLSYATWLSSNNPNNHNQQGVTIDYVNYSGYVHITKPGGVDKVYDITDISASRYNDIFILFANANYTLDGLGGTQDKIDYSADSLNTGSEINVDNVMAINNNANGGIGEGGANGTVRKGQGGVNVDTFSNINWIVGSTQADVFNIAGSQDSSMIYDGAGGNNSIDYSKIYDAASAMYTTISYNLKSGALAKRISDVNGNVLREIQDTIYNFQIVTATDGDDVFILEDGPSWQSGTRAYYAGNDNFQSTNTITTIPANPSGNAPYDLKDAGDVLYINYNIGTVKLNDLEQIFHEFTTLRLSDTIDTRVDYDESAHFSNIWGGIYGARDTFYAKDSSNALTFDINNNVAVLGTLSLYNFSIFFGSDSGTIFNIFYDGSKKVSYTFHGGNGQDTLDYSGSSDGATPASVSLRFDLGKNFNDATQHVDKLIGGVVNSTDYFDGIENFKGGDGDDIFLVNPNNTSYKIDGGGGYNTVSFENYDVAVSDSNVDSTIFTNIDAYILTNLDDTWQVNETTADGKNYDVTGGGGTDTVLINPNYTGSITYDVGVTNPNNPTSTQKVIVLSLGSYNHVFNEFDIFNGSAGGGDTVNMSSVDNTGIVAPKPGSSSLNLYFLLNGSNNTINYTNSVFGNVRAAGNGVILDLFAVRPILSGVSATLSVTKGGGAIDYYNMLSDSSIAGSPNQINLGGGHNTIKIEIGTDFSGLVVNANKNGTGGIGGGDATVDVSSLGSIPIYFDNTTTSANAFQLGSYSIDSSGNIVPSNPETFNIYNWNELVTGDGDDYIKLGSNTQNLTVRAGFGDNTLDVSAVGSGLDITLEDMLYGRIAVANGATSIANYYGNVNDTIIAGGGVTFMGIYNNGYTLDGGGTGSTVNYTQANTPSGFSFILGTTADDTDYQVQKGAFTDTLKNIQSIIGTASDDTFNLFFNPTVLNSIDGGSGRDTLIIKSSSTAGYKFDLAAGTLTDQGGGGSIGFKNFDVLTGSSFDDTFSLSDAIILNNHGSIDGGGPGSNGDTLEMGTAGLHDYDWSTGSQGAMGALVSLYIDLAIGKFYRKSDTSNSPVLDQYIDVKGIKNINLVDGDNVIVFSSGLTSGGYVIDMGKGTNLVSFERLNNPLGTEATPITMSQITSQYMGGATITATGGTLGYKLTNFSDYFAVQTSDASLVIDSGGGSQDTVDYKAITTDVNIDFTINDATLDPSSPTYDPNATPQIQIDRGGTIDYLTSFNIFKLGTGTNTVIASEFMNTEIVFGVNSGGTNVNTMDYSNIQGGVVAMLDNGGGQGIVFKAATARVDRVQNLTDFVDSQGSDTVFASNGLKNIWGNNNSNTLNLTRLTGITGTLVYSTAASATSSLVSGSGVSFNINTNATGGRHTYDAIWFGDYNSTVATATVEGRRYVGTSGNTNTLDYSGLGSGVGIDINVSGGFAQVNSSGTTTQDHFTNFNTFKGGSGDNIFGGLSSSSNLNLILGSGDNLISYDSSTSAITNGVIDSNGFTGGQTGGGVTIDNTANGTQSIGLTRFNDIVAVTDMSVFTSKKGGVDGMSGNDTLRFNLTTGTGGFDISNIGYTFTVRHFDNYIFTGNGNNVSWTYNPADTNSYYLPKFIDFGTGTNDNFTFYVDNLAANTTISFVNDLTAAATSPNSLRVSGGSGASAYFMTLQLL